MLTVIIGAYLHFPYQSSDQIQMGGPRLLGLQELRLHGTSWLAVGIGRVEVPELPGVSWSCLFQFQQVHLANLAEEETGACQSGMKLKPQQPLLLWMDMYPFGVCIYIPSRQSIHFFDNVQGWCLVYEVG